MTARYVFGVLGLPVLEAALMALDRAAQARDEIEKTELLIFGWTGDGIVLVMKLRGVDCPDAVRELAGRP